MSEESSTQQPDVTVGREGNIVVNSPGLAEAVKQLGTGESQALAGLNIICPVINSTAHCGALTAQ